MAIGEDDYGNYYDSWRGQIEAKCKSYTIHRLPPEKKSLKKRLLEKCKRIIKSNKPTEADQ